MFFCHSTTRASSLHSLESSFRFWFLLARKFHRDRRMEASHSRPVGVTVRELNPFKFQHENDCFRMMGNWNRLLLLDYPSQLTVALVSCSLEDSPRAAISSNCKIRTEKFNRFILFERVIVPANQILLISRKQITNK